MTGLAAAGLALCLAGCSVPPRETGFDSSDPMARLSALRDAVARGDRDSIPQLISMLGSDDPALRMFAIRSLEDFTGQTLGYDHAGPEAERDAAIERWVDWWRQEGGSGGSVASGRHLTDHEAVPGGAGVSAAAAEPDRM